MKHSKTDNASLLTQALVYRLENMENEVQHHSYSDEQRMDVMVKNADPRLPELLSNLDTATSIYHAGKMAISREKQVEYYAVLAITFCVRSGIRAGLDPSEAYSINDIGLQRLSEAATQEECSRIIRDSVEAILSRVRSLPSRSNGSAHVRRARQFILKNLNRDFTLEELAEYVGLSPSYLSSLFSREEGMTVKAYTQSQRIAAAMDLLKMPHFTIEQIAFHLCFCSQSHFTAVFRKYAHTTPEAYRKAQFRD